MTKKDYILIARVLHASRPKAARPALYAQWETLREEFSHALKKENSSFNEEKFIEATEKE